MNQIGADRLNALSAGGVYEGYSNKTTVPLTVECTGSKAPKLLSPVLNLTAIINILHEIPQQIMVLASPFTMVMILLNRLTPIQVLS